MKTVIFIGSIFICSQILAVASESDHLRIRGRVPASVSLDAHISSRKKISDKIRLNIPKEKYSIKVRSKNSNAAVVEIVFN